MFVVICTFVDLGMLFELLSCHLLELSSAIVNLIRIDISDKDDSVEGLDREKHNTGDCGFLAC